MKFQAGLLPLAAITAQACLLPEEIEAERKFIATGNRPSRASVLPPHSKRQSSAFPIGQDDRFSDGTVAPVGLGVDDTEKDSILNPGEVSSGLRGLAAAYPDSVELFTPPFTTYEGAKIPGALIGGKEPKVFLMSGIHARERGGPDHTLYFIGDLLAAKEKGSGITYGDVSYTAEQVETALGVGAVVIPLTNPDGVAYDQSSDSCWRKNRNPGNGGTGDSVGIDLNRNFDFVWDYKTAFNLDADIGSAASDDPSSEIYHGTAAFSEPESQAIEWAVMQYNQSLTWFLDLHSYGSDILYGWGDDDVGTQDADQYFTNKKYDGKRGFTGTDPADSQYKEFFTAADLATEKSVTSSMAKSMNSAGDVTYEPSPAVALYPTSGASNDWVMGRYYGKECGAGRVFGLTVEFGAASRADPSCPFYPTGNEYHNTMRQVGAGMMEMMLAAAGDAGKPIYYEC